jgi:hypothetical protein
VCFHDPLLVGQAGKILSIWEASTAASRRN